MTRKNKYVLASLSCLVWALVFVSPASALDVGTNEITNTIQLSAESPIKIASRIINIFMMSLGTIAVGLIIFAGFKWMTSGGNEENIAAAKKILRNAVIGLVIILSSWGITAFILGRLLGDTNNQGGNILGGNKNGVNLGASALGSCTVQSVYPEPEQKEVPRNTAVMITFMEDVDFSTICVDAASNACACDNTSACEKLNKEYFKIYEGALQPDSASPVEAIVRHSDNRTLVVTPVLPLGSPSGNTWYTTYLSNDIKALSGCPNGAASCGMFDTCATDYYRWQFEVNNKLDLTPPQVVLGGIFPEADGLADTVNVNSALAVATGRFRVIGVPKTYIPAHVDSVVSTPSGAQVGTVSLESTYNETTQSVFSVTSILGDKAQLYKGSVSLGVATFNNNSVTFPGYFTLTIGGDGSHPVGYLWTITISPAQRADTVSVGADTYTFTTSTISGYNIPVNNNASQQAINIAAALSSRSDILASADSINVNIESKVAGSSGNSINLAINSSALTVSAMSGGSDNNQTTTIRDKKDQPMNSTIQINFTEAINPVSVSGSAGDVRQTIQVINDSPTARVGGTACAQNSGCLSYKCENDICVGDYVDGQFDISNGYKTVEFRTNNECGMNGCGEKIYCLPADSNLQVKINTANLAPCLTNDDCSTKSPYNICADNSGLFKSCRNSSNENYPLANTSPLVGVTDAAFNALDGNRDGNADGPISFYDENTQLPAYKDNYRFSFFVTDQIDATPPKITSIIPSSSGASVNLSDPIVIIFSKLIMNSSLKSGVLKMNIGTTTIEHKLLNLRATTNVPTGYWTTSENLDISTPTGVSQITQAKINHSMFSENIDYISQVGSGVKDIFQNCFKPSSGPGCEANQTNPSCCNGVPRDILDDGNCVVNN